MTGETSRRNRKPDDAMKAAIAFVERINACDAEGSCELMTEDHRFVDSTGAAHVGRERMREAWLQYLRCFPITESRSQQLSRQANGRRYSERPARPMRQ